MKILGRFRVHGDKIAFVLPTGTTDAEPVRYSASEKPLNAAEKLELFLRVRGRVNPTPETELAFLRLTNAANAERWTK